MDQHKLLPSGVQPWSKSVVSCRSSDDHEEQGSNIVNSKFAFCSSLAVFVIDAKDGSVVNILAGYEGLLSGLVWSPYDPNLIVTASHDGRLVLWDLEMEQRSAVISLKQAPQCISWLPMKRQLWASTDEEYQKTIAVATVRGSILLWHIGTSRHSVLVKREPNGGLSSVELKRWKDAHRPTVLRCNGHDSSDVIACGFKDGRIELISLSKKKDGQEKFYYNPKERACSKKRMVGTSSEVDSWASVSDLQWDPFSPNYLLAAYQHVNDIVLWDCENLAEPKVVMRFPLKENRVGAVISLAWQTWAPGSFASVSEKNCGVIHLWNVSQKSPTELVQVSTESSIAGLSTWGSLCVIPFDNGAVGAYNLKRRLNLHSTKPGHRETVFDVKFSPEDPNTFATCSFDGKIKIWDSNTLNCTRTMKIKDKPIIYCVSWSPEKFGMIAGCTITGLVTVWDTKAGKQLCALNLHKDAVYRVDWNKVCPQFLASSSGDKTLVISMVDLGSGRIKEYLRFKHPNKVFGCAWNTFYTETANDSRSGYGPWVASGSQDGIVRIWNVATASGKNDQPQYELHGHKNKVFNVAWSPLRPGMLASGSDDKTVCVWKLSKDSTKKVEPYMIFMGHQHNVRALLWSTELPHILLSGSWDGTIRIWDVDMGTLLASICDHHADVYGLDIHPKRPFTIVSSSRDTTVRFWQQTAPHVIDQCYSEMLTSLILDQTTAPAADSSTVLQGRYGQALVVEVESAMKASTTQTPEEKKQLMIKLSTFFHEQTGLDDFWALASKGTLSKNGTKQIHDCRELIAHQEKALLKKPKLRGSSQASSEEYVQRLCRLGDFRTACEYLQQDGKWLEALALAPAVSMEYWKTVSKSYAAFLAGTHSESSVAHWFAAKDVDSAIDFYKKRGQLEEAMVLAQVDIEAIKTAPPEETATETLFSKSQVLHGDYNEPLQAAVSREKKLKRDELARLRAKRYLQCGQPVLASSSLLAIDDVAGALYVLLITGEEHLALCLEFFKNGIATSISHDTLTAFVDRCERTGSAEAALRLLRQMPNPSLETHLFAARVNLPPQARSTLGIRQSNQYVSHAADLEDKANDLLEFLPLLCASGDGLVQAKAVMLGVRELCQILQSPRWDIPRGKQILKVLHSINLEDAIPEEDNRDRLMLFALSMFFALLDAIWREYDNLVLPIARTLRQVLDREPNIPFPVSNSRLCLIECKFMTSHAMEIFTLDPAKAQVWMNKAKKTIEQCLRPVAPPNLNEGDEETEAPQNEDEDEEEEHEVLEELKSLKAQLESYCSSSTTTRQSLQTKRHKIDPTTILYSHALPNGNVRLGKRSLFTGEFIRGPFLQLDANGSKNCCIAYHDALLWSKLTPYSPLGTGAKIFQSKYSSSVRRLEGVVDVAQNERPMEDCEDFIKKTIHQQRSDSRIACKK